VWFLPGAPAAPERVLDLDLDDVGDVLGPSGSAEPLEWVWTPPPGGALRLELRRDDTP
jgi:hypothetical protein